MFRPRVCLCILCPLIGLALVLFLLLSQSTPQAAAQVLLESNEFVFVD